MSVEPYIGEVQMFAFNFAPRGFMQCCGQELPISSNTALFSLLGTTYGGDGRRTFRLPDLRGRSPVNVGAFPGSEDNIFLGARIGREHTYLYSDLYLSSHSHALKSTTTISSISSSYSGTGIGAIKVQMSGSDKAKPRDAYLAPPSNTSMFNSNTSDLKSTADDSVVTTVSATTDLTIPSMPVAPRYTDVAGSRQPEPIDNRSPSLAVYFAIAVMGLYPQRPR